METRIDTQEYDVIIIGGGPAGLSCALECKDSNLSHVVLEAETTSGGQLHEIVVPIPNLAASVPENGSALAAEMERSCSQASCNIKLASRVETVDFEKMTVEGKNYRYRGRAIFIATGARFRKPDFKNQEKFSSRVFYKFYVNPEIFRDKELVVVGGGDSALYKALELEPVARKITIVIRSDRFAGRSDLVEEVLNNSSIDVIRDSVITALKGKSDLETLVIENQKYSQVKEIRADYVWARLGYQPNSELFEGKLELTEKGHILVDENLATNRRAVYAGGDVSSCEFDRIAIAMGHGSLAASSIQKYLKGNCSKSRAKSAL